jgi:hypothetical protein
MRARGVKYELTDEQVTCAIACATLVKSFMQAEQDQEPQVQVVLGLLAALTTQKAMAPTK